MNERPTPAVRAQLRTIEANLTGSPATKVCGSRVSRQARVLQRYAGDDVKLPRRQARLFARSRSKTGGKHPFGQLRGQRSRYETAKRTGGLK